MNYTYTDDRPDSLKRREAELLASYLIGSVNYAPDSLTNLIYSDLRKIRSSYGYRELLEISVHPLYGYCCLLVIFDPLIAADVYSGYYTAWDDFNNKYGVDEIVEYPSEDKVELHLRGRPNIIKLKELYFELPGVIDVGGCDTSRPAVPELSTHKRFDIYIRETEKGIEYLFYNHEKKGIERPQTLYWHFIFRNGEPAMYRGLPPHGANGWANMPESMKRNIDRL